MNPIDNIMDMLDNFEYAVLGVVQGRFGHDEVAQMKADLRAAIEQALAPAPVPEGYALIGLDALKAWGKYDLVREACQYPTSPQPQPKQEPFATMTVTKNMGAQFKFNRSHILLPGQVFYVYTAPQPQPNSTVPALNDADSVDCPRCGHCCPDDTAQPADHIPDAKKMVQREWVAPDGMKVAEVGFVFDGEAQQQIPKAVVHFEPVPVNSPANSKGWQDRDAFVSMLREKNGGAA